jgi:hypothetical protein
MIPCTICIQRFLGCSGSVSALGESNPDYDSQRQDTFAGVNMPEVPYGVPSCWFTLTCATKGSIVFSWSLGKKTAEDTQPRKIASIVNCMFGSHFKHVSRTNRSHMKQFWSMFESHVKHVSRTNMLCYPISKFMCRSQYKAILAHVWITF